MLQVMIIKYLGICCFGVLMRIILLKSDSITKSLGSRVEVSTPISSWKRAIEGVSLWQQGKSPYDSDIFHESPIGLVSYSYLLNNAADWIPVVFAFSDLLTALALSATARIYLKSLAKKESDLSKFPENATSILLKYEDVKWVPFYVAAVYLLCPYSIVSCGGKSTATFQNLILSVFILCTVSSHWFIASVLLAVLSCHTLYYCVLLLPLILYTQQVTERNFSNYYVLRISAIIFIFAFTCGYLLTFFREILGSWEFLGATYGFVLEAPDLTPNIGLFWYFFTEMFEHFRIFFLWTFQLNVFIYTVPLAIRLRKEPIFYLFLHIIIITIFKSYPSIGEVALYLSLLPMWTHLFNFTRQKFITCCIFAACTLLGPTLWHLWIYSGSANSNFFFGITLAFNTAQVFLITDILSAYVKREYYLEKGINYNKDGTVALIRLK